MAEVSSINSNIIPQYSFPSSIAGVAAIGGYGFWKVNNDIDKLADKQISICTGANQFYTQQANAGHYVDSEAVNKVLNEIEQNIKAEKAELIKKRPYKIGLWILVGALTGFAANYIVSFIKNKK